MGKGEGGDENKKRREMNIPVPGGPWNKTPLGGVMPNCWNNSG